jgi:transitional endoplasmic reticulum ATPase
MMAGFKSERRPASLRNTRPASVGIRRSAQTRQMRQGQRIADEWILKLAEAFDLDAVDAAVFELALYYRLDRHVQSLFDTLIDNCHRGHNFQRDPELIALLLGIEAAEIETRLTPQARLLASGLVYQERDGELHVLDRLLRLIRCGAAADREIRDQLLGPTIAPTLDWQAFAHLGREAEIAASVLGAALARGESGVNILLYGPPGIGKTSFSATLANRVGANLRAVAESDEEGGEPTGGERLAGLRMAQRLAAARNTVLLFDEAEDLFMGHGRIDEPVRSRVFIHRVLERMQVPVIWTANEISVLGPAVLRRMTMCIELKLPRRKESRCPRRRRRGSRVWCRRRRLSLRPRCGQPGSPAATRRRPA